MKLKTFKTKGLIIFYSTVIIFLLIAPYATGQTILKKKEVSSRLELISNEIANNEFENAMNVFFNKSEIIKKENVSKKLIEKYDQIAEILNQKKVEFDNNKIKVDNFKKQNEDKAYCSATGLLSLNLTDENSYRESQETKSKLTLSLIDAKQRCENNGNNIVEWLREYNAGDYEQIYKLLDQSSSEKNYFNSEDLQKLELLQNDLREKYEIYSSVKNAIILIPTKTINDLNFNDLSYAQSERLIDNLTNVLNISSLEIQKLEGTNPMFLSEYAETKINIENTLTVLREFSLANKPLTNGEVTQKVFSDQSISVDFIKNNCIKGNESFYDIFNLNVFRYFKLYDFNTDLKKKMFKNTPEYLSYLKKLKNERSKMLKSTYYVQLDNLFLKSNYDLKHKGFYITIGKNWGSGTMEAKPPKSFTVWGGLSGDFIQLKSLPTKQINDEFWGNGIKKEILFISTSELIALEIENNKKDIVVYFLFSPSTLETIKYEYKCTSYGWYDMTNKVVTANKTRMIIANKKTDKIYIDKIY